MAVPVFERITADNSEKYKLSIRLQPDGLSFSGYAMSEGDSFFYEEAVLDRSKPYMDALKEYFFAHDFFSLPFQKIRFVIHNSFYTLLPKAVFDPSQKEQLFSFLYGQQSLHICSQFVQGDADSVLLFGIETELYEFLSRTFIRPDFVHFMQPQLNWWIKKSAKALPGQCYVTFSGKQLDVVLLRQGKLLFANTFSCAGLPEMLYYILAIWQQQGFDALTDQLFLAGYEAVLRNELTTKLRIYLQHIYPMDIPTEAFLLGTAVSQAPLDLIALSLCE